MIDLLVDWIPLYAQDDLPQLLHLAVRLGRSGAVRAVYGQQPQLVVWKARQRKHQLPIGELEELLRSAARGSSSMVQSVMLLPGATRLPGGGLQVVMEECRRQHVGSETASWLWPQQQQQLSQQPSTLQEGVQHQFAGVQIAKLYSLQQQRQQRLAEALQQPQPLMAVQLLQAMQSGQHPDQHARAMLPAGAALDEGPLDGDVIDALIDAMDAVEQLLKAALQLPRGKQQQAWVALLCNSRVGKHLHHEEKERILLAAVDAAHINSCCKPLQELCRA
jgi:hypothetical protein